MDNLFGDMLKQAKKVQEEMERAQKEFANKEYQGESGAGMVSIIMTGRHDVKKVCIDPSLLTEDKSLLEDLIAAAVNDAVRKIEANTPDPFSNLASGFKMPEGFKMPF